ncbi:unnamed protein product [Allacma fusca]|uniref:Uncharacterized protein n=1 Tax=Allacma fusca TaxID=39272 RepID=A0A8J2J4Y0_9HEXA|nr:unnamed protein product [Allacma fusca]
MPETPIQSPSAAQRLQGSSIDEPQMTEQIGLLQNPSSPVLTTTKQQRMLRNISSLAVMVKRAELSPCFEVYNDDEELLLKGKITGKKSHGNQKEVLVFTSENENFLKLEFEEDEASQDIKSFSIMVPEQNTVLASVDFDRKATTTSIRDLCDNQNYTVKYDSNEISIKSQEGRDLAKIMVKTEVTTNMGGFKPTSKSPIFALTFEPGIRPEQKVIFVGYTIAIGVFFSKETRTTLYGGIVFILLILVVCVGIFIYFTNNMQNPNGTKDPYAPKDTLDSAGKPVGNLTSHTTPGNTSTTTTNTSLPNPLTGNT